MGVTYHNVCVAYIMEDLYLKYARKYPRNTRSRPCSKFYEAPHTLQDLIKYRSKAFIASAVASSTLLRISQEKKVRDMPSSISVSSDSASSCLQIRMSIYWHITRYIHILIYITDSKTRPICFLFARRLYSELSFITMDLLNIQLSQRWPLWPRTFTTVDAER
jgi:hypothetical protein